MGKLKETLRSFDDYKKEVGFKRESISPEDETVFREFFDVLSDKEYAAIVLVGSVEDQMCGIVGNASSLTYLLAKGMLADEDLYHCVQSALLMRQSLTFSGDGNASKGN